MTKRDIFVDNYRNGYAVDSRTRYGGPLEFIAALGIRTTFRAGCDWLNY